jgi:aldehyde dehydrogenase (NAD+)
MIHLSELIVQIVSKQREYYNTGATRSLSFRKEQMRKLYYLVSDHTEEIGAALSSDLGKPLQEALGAELTMTLQDIINTVKNVIYQIIKGS